MFASVESTYINDAEVRDFLGTAMNTANLLPPSTPAKSSIGGDSSSYTKKALDESSREAAAYLIPDLQVVTPERFLDETFGKDGCGELPEEYDRKGMQLSGLRVGEKEKPESRMWSELASIHHSDNFFV